MFKKKTRMLLYNLSEWLLVVGGVNWGLGLFDFNLVTFIGESINNLATTEIVVYGAVGISALYLAFIKIMGGDK